MKRTTHRFGAIATSVVLLGAVAAPAMANDDVPASDGTTAQDVVVVDDGAGDATNDAADAAPADGSADGAADEAPVDDEAISDDTTTGDPAIAAGAPSEVADPVGSAPAAVAAPVAVTTVHSTDKDAAGWGMEDRTFGHHEYVADGLHVWTEAGTANPGLSQSKAAGYVAASFPLADAAATRIDFASTSGVRPSVQLAVDRDGNGTWDGYLVYEPWAYGDGSWWTSKAGFGVSSGMGYASFGTIDAFVAANPDARVIGVGYSLGSGVIGDAVISRIVVGGATYTFGLAPVVVTPPGPVFTLHSTDKDAAGWGMENRTFGHHEYVADGLHVWTEAGTANPGLSQSKAAGYVAASFPLADAAATRIDFASSTGVRPSVQLAVDRDGNGTWDGYLVYEPWAYGDGSWWTSKAGFGVGSGMGYSSFGTIDDFVAANPDARVIGVGYSLGSGVIGDAVISRIVVGGATYTFGLAPTVTTPPAPAGSEPTTPAVPAAPVADPPVVPANAVLADETDARLAATGSQAGLLALVGAAIIAAGVGLRRIARR
ncbi:hypothetical protein [Cellulomonas sp. ICMP 17802]|uniref:hypothetical protein n=1 Tax=Cellulomonas sp. ICMP 17802 TaxID=3239199 RepID=UPI00351B2A0E